MEKNKIKHPHFHKNSSFDGTPNNGNCSLDHLVAEEEADLKRRKWKANKNWTIVLDETGIIK